MTSILGIDGQNSVTGMKLTCNCEHVLHIHKSYKVQFLSPFPNASNM